MLAKCLIKLFTSAVVRPTLPSKDDLNDTGGAVQARKEHHRDASGSCRQTVGIKTGTEIKVIEEKSHQNVIGMCLRLEWLACKIVLVSMFRRLYMSLHFDV